MKKYLFIGVLSLVLGILLIPVRQTFGYAPEIGFDPARLIESVFYFLLTIICMDRFRSVSRMGVALSVLIGAIILTWSFALINQRVAGMVPFGFVGQLQTLLGIAAGYVFSSVQSNMGKAITASVYALILITIASVGYGVWFELFGMQSEIPFRVSFPE